MRIKIGSRIYKKTIIAVREESFPEGDARGTRSGTMQTALHDAMDASTVSASSTPPARARLNLRASFAARNHASTASGQRNTCTRRITRNTSRLGYNSGSVVPTSALGTPKRRSADLKTTGLPNSTPRRRRGGFKITGLAPSPKRRTAGLKSTEDARGKIMFLF